MRKRAVFSCILEAERVFRDEGPASGIWLLENAFQRFSDAASVRSLSMAAQRISDAELAQAVTDSTQELEYSLHILNHPHNMTAEEWMLVIGHISEAHCVEQIAKRTGREVSIPLLGQTIETLRSVSSDFSDVEFRRSLSKLCSRYPNLLPLQLRGIIELR